MLCYTREARTRKPQHSLTSCSIRVLRCLSVSFRSCPFRAASDVAAPAGHLCECFGTALRKESVPVPLLTLFGVQGLLLRTGLQELQQQGRFAVLKVGVRTYINTYTYTYIYIYIFIWLCLCTPIVRCAIGLLSYNPVRLLGLRLEVLLEKIGAHHL